MKQIFLCWQKTIAILFLPVLFGGELLGQCGPATPSFVVNLVGSPTGTYISPNTNRNDTCCGGIIAGECVKFIITLDPNAIGINFGFASGAQPPGALFYQIACAGSQSVGTPICLNGPGPHVLTFCKPGGNSNQYQIVSVPKPDIPDSIMVRDGCSQTLTATGFSVPTINWTAVNHTNVPQANSYLSCTSGCSMVVVTPTGNPGQYIDYEVSGYAASPCQANFYRDTVRVYFYSNLLAQLTPTTICFGSISANLSPSVSGGKPGYTYTWSTGSNAQTITVGAGNYTVTVGDQTGCPPTTGTVTVGQFTIGITANPGPNQVLCKSSPNIVLNGSVTGVTTGSWSGGTGTFSPSFNSLAVTYIPTPAEISSGSVQLFLGTTGNQGCPPGTGSMTATFQNPPIANAGTDKTVCANNNVTPVSGTITNFPSTFLWTSSGTGTLSSTTSSNFIYTPSAGDNAVGTVSMILTTTNNGACPPARDTVLIRITPQPTVNAGVDQTICSTFTASLNGTVLGPTNTGTWTTLGDGTFNPPATNLTAGYVPGINDINTGSVSLVLVSTNHGNCNPVRDTLKLFIRKITIVSAGNNQVICSSQNSVSLLGSVSGGTNTGSWTSGGAGSFIPNNSTVSTAYSLTPADITNGTVAFTLTSAPNGPCPSVTDSVMIRIKTVATVSAGANQFVCSAQNSISLSGTITGVTGNGAWASSGAGTFVPSNNILNTTYVFSPADALVGLVTFTLTSINNDVCPARTDTVRMRIMRQATVSAGPNQVICSTPGTIALNGSVLGTSVTGIWNSSGIGTFSLPVTTLTNNYSVSPADITNGTVAFTLTSTNNGPCPAQSDSVLVRVQSIATVSAGPPQVICSTQNTILLSGNISGVTNTGSWTASGTGNYTPSNNILNTSYSLTPADINSGTVNFTLTTTNNGMCPSRSSTVNVQVVKPATVSAGASQSICSNAASVSLTGTVSGSTSTGIWNSGGGGTYSPSNTALSTAYMPTPGDIAAGSMVFTLSSSNNGPCAAVQSTVRATFFNLGIVSGGASQTICASQKTVGLSGIVSGAAGTGSWSASGGGSFVPNNVILNTSYSLTTNDINLGTVTFTLRSTNTGPCPVQSSTVLASIVMTPTVKAMPDATICSSQNSIALSGTVTGGSVNGSWSTNGAGIITPGPGVNASYALAGADAVAGMVRFIFTSANSGPCGETQDTVNIVIKSPAIVSAGANQVLCSDNNTVQLSGSVIGIGATITWTSSGGGQFTPSGTDPSAVYSLSASDISSGSVIFTLSVTNNSPCPLVSDTVKVVVHKKASVSSGADKFICATLNTFNLSGSISGITTTGTWSTTGSGVITSPNSVNTTYSVSAADINAGTIVFVLVSNNNGVCSSVADTMKLTIIKKAVIDLKADTTICEKQNPFRVRALVTDASGPLLWVSASGGSFTPNAYSALTFYNLTPGDIKNGNVLLTITANNNSVCGNSSASMKVNILPSAKAAFSASSYSMYLPAEAVLFTNSTTDAETYKWSFGDGINTTVKEPSHTYTGVGFFTVTLIANNEFKCSDTLSRVITVLGDVLFPNAFTPNPNGSNGGTYSEKDFSNDVFFPFTGGVIEYDLMIFDRWGELIFRSRDINIGWDGYFNGKLCQQDAYVWKASMTFFDGRSFNKTGSVTLIR